jgi:hypothetical protein
MTLSVPFDQFAREVKERLPNQPVYLRWKNGRVFGSAGDPSLPLIVLASGPLSLAAAEHALQSAGLDVRKGEWGVADPEDEAPIWLGVVAYRSDEAKPGLWVEAFPVEPTSALVVETMLEEFRRQGLVGEVSLEQFVAKADLNTMIFAPEQLAQMASREAAAG